MSRFPPMFQPFDSPDQRYGRSSRRDPTPLTGESATMPYGNNGRRQENFRAERNQAAHRKRPVSMRWILPDSGTCRKDKQLGARRKSATHASRRRGRLAVQSQPWTRSRRVRADFARPGQARSPGVSGIADGCRSLGRYVITVGRSRPLRALSPEISSAMAIRSASSSCASPRWRIGSASNASR